MKEKDTGKDQAAAGREERLAEALRANLKRRKQAARMRAQAQAEQGVEAKDGAKA
ncbi:hypothetical protein [Polymorphum gilvum]|uniref:hypothetical protein n=1 Tax=Polymorphum gilvum TaxID=991904 RepID=UPI00030EEEE5|nr:hypothetical protein [Polymorphum gilvum]